MGKQQPQPCLLAQHPHLLPAALHIHHTTPQHDAQVPTSQPRRHRHLPPTWRPSHLPALSLAPRSKQSVPRRLQRPRPFSAPRLARYRHLALSAPSKFSSTSRRPSLQAPGRGLWLFLCGTMIVGGASDGLQTVLAAVSVSMRGAGVECAVCVCLLFAAASCTSTAVSQLLQGGVQVQQRLLQLQSRSSRLCCLTVRQRGRLQHK